MLNVEYRISNQILIASLKLALSDTPKTGFLATRPIRKALISRQLLWGNSFYKFAKQINNYISFDRHVFRDLCCCFVSILSHHSKSIGAINIDPFGVTNLDPKA